MADESYAYEEGYGPIGSLIGAGSHLEGERLNDLLGLVSLELMRRATAAGLAEEGARALREVLLLWMRKHRKTPYDPLRVVVYLSEFGAQNQKRLERGLRLLGECLPVTRQDNRSSVFEVDLSPWLRDDDHELISDLHHHWLAEHVRVVQSACHGAELMIASCLDLRLPQSQRPGIEPRLTILRKRWEALKLRLKLTRSAHLQAAMRDPWAMYEEVAELEHLHECVVGLQMDPDATPFLFSDLWKAEGRSKLQALALPPPVAAGGLDARGRKGGDLVH